MAISFLSKGIVRQYMVGFAGSITFLMSGQSNSWPSPILPKIMAHEAPVNLDIIQITWMVSIMYIGTMVSPVFSSYLMDEFGRKKALLYTVILQVCSWFFILFARSLLLLYLARFLAGLYWGIITTIQPVYLGEIAQPDIRGSFGFLSSSMYHVGNLLIFIIGPYTSYNGLAIISMLPIAVFLITFCFMPESPYYFVIKGDEELARKSLLWLRDKDKNMEFEKEMTLIKETVKEHLKNKGSFKDIFGTKASRKAFVICECFGMVKKLSGTVLYVTFASVTLPKLTFNSLNTGQCVIIIGIIEVISSFFIICLADRYGRRTLLTISCLGCSITMFISALWYYLDTNTSLRVNSFNFIPFIAFTLHVVSHCLALGPVANIIKGELLPTNVKSKIASIMVTTSSFASFLIYKNFLIIAYDIGMYFNFIIFGVFSLFGLVITIVYVPETKGKTFQEIQQILSGEKNQCSNNCTPIPPKII